MDGDCEMAPAILLLTEVGCAFERLAEQAVRVAKQEHKAVVYQFNGRMYVAGPFSTERQLIESFEQRDEDIPF